jgi:hypothetical protein
MRKLACSLLLLLICAAAPAQAQTVPTKAGLESCHTGGAPLDRFAVFFAQMSAVPQSTRMQVRFDLQQRLSGGEFRGLKAPGLGVWRSSAPGIDIFRYRKQVANLQAAATYRALVRFRWLDATGRVIQSASKRTKSCKQPDVRADLALDRVTAEPAGQGRARYGVVVRNDGRSATPTFGVGFAIGDQGQPRQTVQALDPGAERTLTFVGPRCGPTTLLRVTLDPDLAVDEADETNDARTVVCPL